MLTSETEVHQFLGAANYCRMLMGPKFADVSRPLVELTKKGVTFAWGPQHTDAVRRLKQQLVEYTALQIPDSAKPYQLYTDASGYAMGAVLEQDNKPLGFHSQVMTPAQRKYCIYDQELLALVTALDRWRHLLCASKVTAYTNHQALTHLQNIRNNKPLRGRAARWLDFLAEFPHLTISYLQGTRNQVADALSRHPQHTVPSRAPLALAVCAATSRYPSRGQRRDCRADAGICTRHLHPQPDPLILHPLPPPLTPLPSPLTTPLPPHFLKSRPTPPRLPR